MPTRARARRLWTDTRGANYAEYLILVAVVAMVGLAGFRVFGETAKQRAECLGGRIAGSGESCGQGEAGPQTQSATQPIVQSTKPDYKKIKGGEGATYEPVKGDAFIKGNGDATAVHPNDVSQGQIGDCYLMSSMASIAARNPAAIENLITKNADGTYTVTFKQHESRPWWNPFASDSWKDVKITVKPDFPSKDGNPVFAQPGDRTAEDAELWPMILEKAYAQYKGSYDTIGQGGWMGDPMQLMTGNKSESLGKNLSFDTLNDKWQNNYALTAATPGDKDVKDNALFKPDGPLATPLVAGHAYFVVNVDPKAQTVTLKNPWGWGSGTFTLTMEQYNQAFVGTAAARVNK